MLSLCLLAVDDLPTERAEAESLAATLPFGTAEWERLRHISHEQTFRQSLGGLLALRELTDQRELSIPLTIVRSPRGKPAFRSPSLPPFSLSHSKSLATAVLGECADGAVGVDLEFIREGRGVEPISRRFFSAEERNALESSECKEEDFYLLWTKKEAYAKYTGQGLSAALDTSPPDFVRFKSFRLTYGGRLAFLTVACPSPVRKIEIHYSHYFHHNKELSLYELPN